MRLFLSSSHFGDHGDTLADMVGAGARVAIVPNALDNLPELKRDYMRTTVAPLFSRYRLEGEELDLGRYFSDGRALSDDLRGFDVLWAIGGNSFLLRRAMKLSGFDAVIGPLLRETSIVYGGWSAGSVVAGKDLYGIDRVDDPLATAPGYPSAPVEWAGLGLVDATVVPHVRSGHPESPAATAAVPFIEASGRRCIALSDGEVLIQDGGAISILPAD